MAADGDSPGGVARWHVAGSYVAGWERSLAIARRFSRPAHRRRARRPAERVERTSSSDRRGAARRREDHRRAARTARRTMVGRSTASSCWSLDGCHAGRRPADGDDDPDRGRDAHRLPDSRRVPHLAATQDRSPHRGRADPADRNRSRDFPAWCLVIFDQVHERNLTGDIGSRIDDRGGGDDPSRPRHDRHVGDAGHRRAAARRSTHRWSKSDGRMFDVDVRWLPSIGRNAANRAAAAGGTARPPRPGRDSNRSSPTSSPRSARAVLRHRRRSRVPAGDRRDPPRRTAAARRRPCRPSTCTRSPVR